MTGDTAGAVAAGHALTADAAADTLRAGGNAFDAVIAGLWMACVAEPVLASPGGGGFLMARDGSTGQTTLYDFFCQTPLCKSPTDALEFSSVHADFGPATQEFHIGHGASATPGFVPGLYALHGDLGTMPMAQLLEPAKAAARDGIEVTRFQAYLSEVVTPILTATASSRALFTPSGALIAGGDGFHNQGLADFYDSLAQHGQVFYQEETVARFCSAQAAQGHLRAQDFAAYRVERRPALTVTLAGAQVALNPPPSAGGAFIAHALQGLDEDGRGRADALARSDAARLRLKGDVAAMLKEAGIDGAFEAGGGKASRGTTHVSVIDGHGNAASATVSNGEGNGHVVEGHGFMLNNMLGEEDLNPKGFHHWLEGARLSSNMCPAVAAAADGSLIALGSGGSNRIRSAVFQVLVRMLRDGLAPENAVHAARLHVEDGHLDFEDDLEPQAREALISAFPNHRAWAERNLFFGGVHAARRTADGRFDAAGDARRGGTAVVV